MILGIIIAVAGLIMIVNPEGVYEVTEGWKSSGGGPSDGFLLYTRVGGVIFLLVGAVCTAILLFVP